ncbi:hypothetical protein [Emticicia sp. W12TSBA100-4]|uniref:hypothetical protein n=1 Tax=Emticicia sp. W12TSBA100-4 TaxID=3160965 RepID=UPI0033063FDB
MSIKIIQILKSVNNILLIISCLLITENSQAQKPIGKFQTDSIELGRQIEYTLSYHHNPSAEVFFPDTTYNFYPFEIINRKMYPTVTTNGVSVDSVIYTLVTFDISKNQKLRLPIYLLSKRDCTAVYSLADSVFLKEMIKSPVDSLQLKTDVRLLPLSQQVNYPKILTYILGLLGLVLIIYAFFGRFIRKQYTLFLFGRRHKDFQTNYKKFTRSTLDDVTIGKALVLWKKHLEWLEKRPYTSYTTKEIISRLPNERLEEALREVDSAIYGGILSTQMPSSMEILLEKATELYKNRREELAASL